ncbi:hypothetical protein LTR36_009825 [Oleoguttula mirabilis]|uniref:Oxysterol-binding protein n=1 Tax=Oleoguttula mirabilis TaxID=1507867 RepID=A0AAV9J601_9PEZI|nr:hypothetical protein LTR36_009825 [Oleoguttula mirabilis]
MYARGILFGKMKYELGDHAIVRCPETGLEADVEFKVKGWMGGTYNAIGGFIKDSKSGKNLYELSGFWHGQMHIKDLSTGKKELFFDASTAKPTFPKARPLNEQGPRESQRLWDPTVRAIKKADQKVATDEKSKIEDEQRKEAADRGEGEAWQPLLFRPVPPGDEEKLDWILKAQVDDRAQVEKQVEQILAITPILPGQGPGPEFAEGAKRPSAPSQTSPPQQSKQQPQQAQRGAGGDLVDFGQHDGSSSAVPSQPTQGASRGLAAGMGGMSLNGGGQGVQQAYQRPSGPGNPVRRVDSSGNEDMFIDAES